MLLDFILFLFLPSSYSAYSLLFLTRVCLFILLRTPDDIPSFVDSFPFLKTPVVLNLSEETKGQKEIYPQISTIFPLRSSCLCLGSRMMARRVRKHMHGTQCSHSFVCQCWSIFGGARDLGAPLLELEEFRFHVCCLDCLGPSAQFDDKGTSLICGALS